LCKRECLDSAAGRSFDVVRSETRRARKLAIVGRIVETHHGEIRIRSRVGRGTTMRIALPVK
jgi:signal transduction histidine kinase